MAKLPENAAQRVLRRIKERLDAERDRPKAHRKDQKGLAGALKMRESSLSELLSSSATRGILVHLDTIAKYLEVPPSELVYKHDTDVMELQREEYRLIEHWRTFPPDIQERLMEAFDYFGGLLPAEKEQRRWWFKLRRLNQREREQVEASVDDLWRAKKLGPRTGADARGPAVASDKGPTTPNAPGGGKKGV